MMNAVRSKRENATLTQKSRNCERLFKHVTLGHTEETGNRTEAKEERTGVKEQERARELESEEGTRERTRENGHEEAGPH